MSQWVEMIDISAVPSGHAMPVEIQGRWYAVCNDGGRFHVVDNECPHAGGSLGRGQVADGCIVCPVHRWPFDLKTGLTDPSYPHMRLIFFACEVRNGKLYADVSQPLPPDFGAISRAIQSGDP